jgi:subtilisin family serine protease
LKLSKYLILLLTSILIACGGGGGSSSSSSTTTTTTITPSVGQFIDAPVSGLTYVCGSYSGTTNDLGQFNYSTDSTCSFTIGNVVVGSLSSIPSDGMVTPHDVAGVSRTADDDPNVQAIAQFLQSVGTTSGGVITISSTVRQNLQSAPANTAIFTSTGPLSQSALSNLVVMGAPTKTLIDSTVAKTAMKADIQQKGINTSIGVVKSGTPVKMSAISVSTMMVYGTNGPAYSVPQGLPLQLAASGNFTDGTTSVITNSVTWSSSNTEVATVNSRGLVTAVLTGTTTITARTAEGFINTLLITVTPATLTSIAVTPASSNIARGLTQQMVATGTYSDGTSAVISASTVTWSSSSTAIATISSSGIVMGVALGSTTINATVGSVSASTPLAVSKTIQSIAVTTANSVTSIPVGIAVQLTATGTLSDGSTVNLSNLVTWVANSSATVSSTGLFTGITTSAVVPVTAAYVGVTSLAKSITLTNPILQTIAITATTSSTAPTASQAPAGYSQNLIATGTYSNGTTQIITTSLTWSSATQIVATVTSGSAGGRVTGVAAGTSVITATDTTSGVSKSVTFTVTAPVLVSIAVSSPTTTNEVGTTVTLTATGTYSNGSTRDLTSLVTWSSSSGFGTISASGVLTGITPGNTNITASLSGISSSVSPITIVNTDPLFPYQWHLKNVGSSAFSSTFPLAGNDMNVTGAWSAGYTGRGIKVAVVDSGLEIAHEDLSANIDQAKSFNFLTGSNNPTPSVTGFDHGTQVAGIIGAVAFNGKGGRGVAYNSTLRGYNLIANGVNYPNNYSNALGGAIYSADNDIFNESFGDIGSQGQSSSLDTISQTEEDVLAKTLTLRNGKGAVVVQSAGNNFQNANSANLYYCTLANFYKVSCGNPAAVSRKSSFRTIVVGAFNADGVKSSYSTAGSVLWVSAPGGEFGEDNTYSLNRSVNSYKPAIITTSLTGCGNASNGTTKINALDAQGTNSFATNCQYTALMNGTSSAAPNVSGVVALMFEANPNLGYRDIKYILAKTAKKIDPTNSGVSSTTIITGQNIVLDQGWVKNAADYWFSTWYGFGAVDATAAVNMAKTYSTYLPTIQTTSKSLQFTSNVSVPFNTTGVTMTFAMSPSFSKVEFITLGINLSSTSALTCNQFELTSPSGTKSILLHAANGYSSNGVTYQSTVSNGRLLSNAFYGESAAGNWTLRLLNFCSGSTTFSSANIQTLSIMGN